MNQDEYKIRNLESQILYLQQEHSSTLKLLHNEIKDLQMKNSETSLQLAMLNITNKEGDIEKNQIDNACLVEQISQLKSEITALNMQLNTKIAQLENNLSKINQLTETVTKLKERHKAEIETMEMELASKCSDIVHLSSKLLKRLDQSKSTFLPPGDTETVSPKPQYTTQSPIAPKTFKFRNQISVHPDNIHLRRRPIIAHQSVLSTSVPIKSMVSQPLFPEYAISIEDRAIFSKSIRRPSILPPIQSTRNQNPNDGRSSSSILLQDSSTEPFHTQYYDVPTIEKQSGSDTIDAGINFNKMPIDPKVVHIEVERLLDVNNSSLHQSTPKTINWNLTKKSPS